MDNHYLWGKGFDVVNAFGVNGGINRLELDTIDYLFSQSGNWL